MDVDLFGYVGFDPEADLVRRRCIRAPGLRRPVRRRGRRWSGRWRRRLRSSPTCECRLRVRRRRSSRAAGSGPPRGGPPSWTKTGFRLRRLRASGHRSSPRLDVEDDRAGFAHRHFGLLRRRRLAAAVGVGAEPQMDLVRRLVAPPWVELEVRAAGVGLLAAAAVQVGDVGGVAAQAGEAERDGRVAVGALQGRLAGQLRSRGERAGDAALPMPLTASLACSRRCRRSRKAERRRQRQQRPASPCSCFISLLLSIRARRGSADRRDAGTGASAGTRRAARRAGRGRRARRRAGARRRGRRRAGRSGVRGGEAAAASRRAAIRSERRTIASQPG